MPNVAIIYYSSTGTNAKMARAVAEGAKEAGAEVRVRIADGLVFESGGNPYGPSVTANDEGPTEADLTHARYLGERVTEVSAKLVG